MDEIPDDIQKAAEQVEQDLRGHSLPMWIAGIIARALLAEREAATKAERERCANVCEEQKQGFLSPQYASNQPLGSMLERFACDECATAIRSGARP